MREFYRGVQLRGEEKLLDAAIDMLIDLAAIAIELPD